MQLVLVLIFLAPSKRHGAKEKGSDDAPEHEVSPTCNYQYEIGRESMRLRKIIDHLWWERHSGIVFGLSTSMVCTENGRSVKLPYGAHPLQEKRAVIKS